MVRTGFQSLSPPLPSHGEDGRSIACSTRGTYSAFKWAPCSSQAYNIQWLLVSYTRRVYKYICCPQSAVLRQRPTRYRFQRNELSRASKRRDIPSFSRLVHSLAGCVDQSIAIGGATVRHHHRD